MNISFNRGITAGVTVFLGKIVVYGYCRCRGFNLFLNNMLKTVRLLWIFSLCSFLSAFCYINIPTNGSAVAVKLACQF